MRTNLSQKQTRTECSVFPLYSKVSDILKFFLRECKENILKFSLLIHLAICRTGPEKTTDHSNLPGGDVKGLQRGVWAGGVKFYLNTRFQQPFFSAP